MRVLVVVIVSVRMGMRVLVRHRDRLFAIPLSFEYADLFEELVGFNGASRRYALPGRHTFGR